MLVVFLAVTQIAHCGVEEQFSRYVQRNDTFDNAEQQELAQPTDPHAQTMKVVAASI